MRFPTKHDHFGVLWGYHHFKETPKYTWILWGFTPNKGCCIPFSDIFLYRTGGVIDVLQIRRFKFQGPPDPNLIGHKKICFGPESQLYMECFFIPVITPSTRSKTAIYRGSKPHCITSRGAHLIAPILGNFLISDWAFGIAIFPTENDEHRVATRCLDVPGS